MRSESAIELQLENSSTTTLVIDKYCDSFTSDLVCS